MNRRMIAAGVLTQVVKQGMSLTMALNQAFETVPDHQDRAFIQAICYGVMRQYPFVEAILQQLLSKPLRNKETDIKMLLLMGLYQIGFMRVKTHVAVSETVAAASKKNWAKSLVNAVLRRYIREQDILHEKVAQIESAQYSHPQWMIINIIGDWPEQGYSILQQNNTQPPMVLRVNLSTISREDYLQQLHQHSMPARAVLHCPSAIILEQAVNVEKLPGFAQGRVSVQDTAAQLAADLLDVQPQQQVLDLCAAPGGKTAAILEKQPEMNLLLAVDSDESRLAKMTEGLQRLQLNANLLVGDATQVDKLLQGQSFDRILVDAPCSALGVIRRHPDIKVLRRKSDVAVLTAIQEKILDAAWAILAPGGILLYATCSVLKAENELQIASFFSRHEDVSEIPITADWGVARKFGRQVLPGDAEMDGFYYARLLKNSF